MTYDGTYNLLFFIYRSHFCFLKKNSYIINNNFYLILYYLIEINKVTCIQINTHNKVV